MEKCYHEKQQLGHCAVHALNNLFQETWTSFSSLRSIARELHDEDQAEKREQMRGREKVDRRDEQQQQQQQQQQEEEDTEEGCFSSLSLFSLYSVNPYMSWIPLLGFFDIAVIIRALQQREARIDAHITRSMDDAVLVNHAALIRGFIVNVQQSSFIDLFSSRHWFSVIPVYEEGTGNCLGYWNLDSKLNEPCQIKTREELLEFFRDLLTNHCAHIFVVKDGVSG